MLFYTALRDQSLFTGGVLVQIGGELLIFVQEKRGTYKLMYAFTDSSVNSGKDSEGGVSKKCSSYREGQEHLNMACLVMYKPSPL